MTPKKNHKKDKPGWRKYICGLTDNQRLQMLEMLLDEACMIDEYDSVVGYRAPVVSDDPDIAVAEEIYWTGSGEPLLED